MYLIKFSKSYKKSFKRLSNSGKKSDIAELEKVINMIASGEKLSAKYRNHLLSGQLAGYQECHIKSDLLLIYYKQEKELVLVLVNIGSHSDLF